MKYEIDKATRDGVINLLAQSYLSDRTYAQVNRVICQLQELKPIKERTEDVGDIKTESN